MTNETKSESYYVHSLRILRTRALTSDEIDAVDIAISLFDRQKGVWIEDKYGNYTENHDTWECSVCHDAFILNEGTPKDNHYNYCPNCGAKMLKGKK